MINLTPENINSNYFLKTLYAGDKVNSSKIDETDAKVKYNPISMSNDFKYFNDDVVAYYDFSDSSNIGRDVGGNKLHGVNSGVSQQLDVADRKYSAELIKNNHTTFSSQYDNQRIISLDKHVAKFRLPAYSVSVWFKTTNTAQQSILNFSSDSSTTTTGKYLDIRVVNMELRVICFIDVVADKTLDMITTGLFPDTWHHVVFTMDSTGNKLFVDEILITGYTTGDENTYVDLSTFKVDHVTFGGIRDNKKLYAYESDDRYSFPYSGNISDAMIFNRAISEEEIDQLYNDNYGYSVIVLAGQSNMLGRDTIELGIDDDYTGYEGKVYMYNTFSNIDLVAPYAAISSTISPATQRLPFPSGVTDRMNMSRTLCNDIIKYSDLPYRRRLLMIPTAWGGTGFITNLFKRLSVKGLMLSHEKSVKTTPNCEG